MFIKLKRKLIFMYGITTSVILTVIIIGISVFNNMQMLSQEKKLFQKNAEQIIEKIRTDNIINKAWMLQLQNNYIIVVEENGKRLSGNSCLAANSVKDKLVWKIKEESISEGINLDRKPLNTKMERTAVYTLDINSPEKYFGMAALLPKDTGRQNIMVFSGNKYRSHSRRIQNLVFFMIDLIGVAALFLISSLYINRVMKPLEEGRKKQNAFVAAASHELRSPLTVIKAGVSAVREDAARADQLLFHVEAECNRMSRLINDMLLLAAADTQTWELRKEPLDMDTLLIECYDMVCSCMNKKQTDITLELQDKELYRVLGDKERLKQVMTILIDNAMNYTPEGASIAIRACNWKTNVMIEVEDHGRGIADENKKLIFERFYRGDESRYEKKHFGLGLSIAKELVQLHHGEIRIHDTPGGGATFVLYLPRYISGSFA